MSAFKYILNGCSNHSKKVCFLLLVLVVALVLLHTGIPFSRMTGVPEETIILQRKKKGPGAISSEEFRSTIDRRVNGTWHNFSTIHFRLYAYSAFFDDRPSLLSPPVIRITAISDEDLEKSNATLPHCVLHHEKEDVIVPMEEIPKPIGLGFDLNGRVAKEYIYSCPTVNGMVPLSVSIATKRNQSLTSGVPVIIPNKPETKRDFCVCVQAVYGTLDPYRIIEWMELQKILGVSLVGVYILSAPDAVLKVFRHYSDEKFVDLRKIDYIYSNKTSDSEFWLHLTPTINDCIYRHMYEFKRIVVIDFDEFIMPRKHQNLSELVSYLDQMFLDRRSPHVNYDFRNNYFFLDLTSDEKVSKYLTFLRFRYKVDISEPGYSVKSIINPQSCISMHNHYCWGVTPNYTVYGNSETIDPEIGLNQHYKKCHFRPKACKNIMKKTFQDDIMMQFKDVLTQNVNKRLIKVMGHGV